MLLFVVFAPLLAALLILIGAPARRTALAGAAATTLVSLAALFLYDPVRGGFQFVTSFPISPSWRLQFLLGADGLSLIMLFLAGLVLLVVGHDALIAVRHPVLALVAIGVAST